MPRKSNKKSTLARETAAATETAVEGPETNDDRVEATKDSSSTTALISESTAATSSTVSIVAEETTAVDIATPRTPKKPSRSASSASKISPAAGGARADKKSPRAAVPPSKLKIKAETERVYKLVKKCSGTLGGNGYDGAIYGELTMHSLQRVIDYLVTNCELNASSRFIDVGSGLGKPNFHAAQDPEVRLSIGVELEEIRWKLAMHNLHETLKHVSDGTHSSAEHVLGATYFLVGDIDQAQSTDPFTHVYMFDLGFPPPLQQSIALKFNTSCHAKVLVSYRPPHRVIEEYGYEVTFVEQILTSMHGSGEGHTAYIYKRNNTPTPITAAHEKVILPGRTRLDESDEEVVCDPMFTAAVLAASGRVADTRKVVSAIVQAQLNAERPKRDRKPRVVA